MSYGLGDFDIFIQAVMRGFFAALVPATVGKPVGGGAYDIEVESSNPNIWYFQRVQPPGIVTGFAGNVPREAGANVLLLDTPEGYYAFLPDFRRLMNFMGADKPMSALPLHTHERGPHFDQVSTERLVDLRLRIVSGLTIYVDPLVYTYQGVTKVWQGGTYDLTSSVPGSGLARVVRVGLDMATNGLVIVEGSTVSAALYDALALNDVLEATSGWDVDQHLDSGGVKLQYGDANLEWTALIETRQLFGGAPAGSGGIPRVDTLYVGKHGNDTHDGTTPDTALLTFGAAITAATALTPATDNRIAIVCQDAGIYAEGIDIPAYVDIEAPDAVIHGEITLDDNARLYVREIEVGDNEVAIKKNAGTGSAYVKVDKVITGTDSKAINNTATGSVLLVQAGQIWVGPSSLGVGDNSSGIGHTHILIGDLYLAGDDARGINAHTADASIIGYIDHILETGTHSNTQAVRLRNNGIIYLTCSEIIADTAYDIEAGSTLYLSCPKITGTQTGDPATLISGVGLRLETGGTTIDEFSTDGTLAGDSDTAIPTEKAVKTYVDAHSGGASDLPGLSDVDSAATTANLVLATPNGTPGNYSGRALVQPDIPNLSANKITTDALALARGGLGADFSGIGSNSIFALSGGSASAIGWFDDKGIDPDANDDISTGVVVGSFWNNTTAGRLWWCIDNTFGAAVWIELTMPGSPNDGDVPTYNSSSGLWEAAAPSGGGTVDPRVCNARLTLETGVPKSTSDQLAKGTLYLTPYKGQLIALYNGSSWEYYTLSNDLSIALSGGTASKLHDVFLDYNGGTPQLALVAWTDDTTRATALTTQDGVDVLTGDATQRWFGTIYIDASNQCNMRFSGGYAASAAAECGVWNAHNQLPQEFYIEESTAVWTVTAATALQAWHSSAFNRVNFVYGKVEKRVLLRFWGLQSVSGGGHAIVDIMLDSTSVSSGDIVAGSNSTSTILTVAYAEYNNFPSAGRHYLQLGELAGTASNTNFYGRGAGALNYQYGGFARIWS